MYYQLKKNLNLSKINNFQRLHHCPVPIIGITGTVASGKSSVTKLLHDQNFPTISADQLIKEIYTQEDTINFIKLTFPNSIIVNKIDFRILRQFVFNDPQKIKILEDYLYPKLAKQFEIAYQNLKCPDFIFYEIPLLFEKNLALFFDYIICVDVQEDLAIQRLMKRDNISFELAKKMFNNQFDTKFKSQNSHYIINNNLDLDHLKNQVYQMIEHIFEQ